MAANTRVIHVHDARYIFREYYMEIDLYQRWYRWEEKQCRELFNDIKLALDSGRRYHRAGHISMVIQPETDSFATTTTAVWQSYRSLVDGQQRLTSLNLLFCAFLHTSKDLWPTKEDDESAVYEKDRRIEELKKLLYPPLRLNENRTNLRLNNSIQPTFEKIIKFNVKGLFNNPPEIYDPQSMKEDATTQSAKLLIENFDFYVRLLQKTIDDQRNQGRDTTVYFAQLLEAALVRVILLA